MSAGLALPDLLRAEAAQGIGKSRKAIIMIYLCGAPPHQDMFDLKMEAPAEIRGEFQPIPTNVPGIQICEHLPRLARIMDKLVPIRTMYGSPNGSHDSFICYTGRSVRSSSRRAAGPRSARRCRSCWGRRTRRFRRSSACRRRPAIRPMARRVIRAFSARPTARFAPTARARPT